MSQNTVQLSILKSLNDNEIQSKKYNINDLGLLLLVGLRGSAVERQSLASVLSPSCARPVADG